jgi:transmembrane sensor
MSEENKKDLKKLVEKYLNGTATAPERQILESYYATFDDAPGAFEDLDDTQLDMLGHGIKEKINQRIRPKESKTIFLRNYFRAAAILVVMLGVVWLARVYSLRENEQQMPRIAASAGKEPVSRFFTLPDGSKVVLHANSQLKLSTDFNRSNRTVYLTGEAYFDVTHNSSSPFIIYTGKVKTTVLGTAFNIQAWPGQKDIIVSVSRGKVRVEDQNKLIAVLTPEKQVTYNTETSVAGEQQVEATEMMGWLQQDVTFDEMSFKDLAVLLSKRFGTDIKFANPELENCRFTGRFSGTETLEEVMRTLSLTSNTRYDILADEVLIDGEKCL